MNNEETIIMQPKNNNNKAQQTTANAESPKEEKNTNSGAKVGATIAAATIGGFTGGVGTVAAAKMMNTEEEAEVQDVENVQDTEAKPSAKPVEPAPTVEAKEEEIPVTVDENGEPDYTGHAGADPVTENPQPTPVSNASEAGEVQVLGVYERTDENGVHQELAVLTDGETVAVVLDANGDGDANVIGIDENMNGHLEEGEIHDISEQHIGMSQFEQEYIAQQQEMEQQMQQEHETFAINADDQQDYNNDAPDLSFA